MSDAGNNAEDLIINQTKLREHFVKILKDNAVSLLGLGEVLFVAIFHFLLIMMMMIVRRNLIQSQKVKTTIVLLVLLISICISLYSVNICQI